MSEPFGYFRSNLDGWEDCAETADGAKALYEYSTIASLRADLEVASGMARVYKAGRDALRERLQAACNPDDTALLKQALEAIENITDYDGLAKARAALKERLK